MGKYVCNDILARFYFSAITQSKMPFTTKFGTYMYFLCQSTTLFKFYKCVTLFCAKNIIFLLISRQSQPENIFKLHAPITPKVSYHVM